MKRFLAIALVLCMVLSMIPITAGARDTLDTKQEAVIQTALAYYYAGSGVEYESYLLSQGTRYLSMVSRQTSNTEPEEATPTHPMKAVCSSFVHDVFKSAFGIHIIDQEALNKIGTVTSQANVNFENYLAGMGLDGHTLTDAELEESLGALATTTNYLELGLYWRENGSDDAHNHKGMVVGYWGPELDANGQKLYTCNTCGTKDLPAVDGVITCTTCAAEKALADLTIQTTTSGMTASDIQGMLQPGDIITARPLSGTAGSGGGHSMIFLGDIFKSSFGGGGTDYIIHCQGAKYNDDNNKTSVFYDHNGQQIHGFDIEEAPGSWMTRNQHNRNGAICIVPFDDFVDSGKAYDIAKSYDFVILRPLNALQETPITSAAQFRLDYPALDVQKFADKADTQGVVKDSGTITYTVNLENATKDKYTNGWGIETQWYGVGPVYYEKTNLTYTDLKVTETIPAGTELVSANGFVNNGDGTLTWTVGSLSATATKSASFTVRPVGEPGSEIVSTKGTISGSGSTGVVHTSELRHHVASWEMDSAALNGFSASSLNTSSSTVRTGTDIAEDIYATLGGRLDLPSVNELVKAITTEMVMPGESTAQNQTKLVLLDAEDIKDEEASLLRQMVVPGYIGGHRLHTMTDDMIRTNEGRLLNFNSSNFQVGDILVYANGKSSTSVRSTEMLESESIVYVYLGNSKFARYENGAVEIVDDTVYLYSAEGAATPSVLGNANDVDFTADGGSDDNRKYIYSQVMYQAFLQDFFVLLRPSLVYDESTLLGSSAANSMAVEAGGNGYADLAAAYAAAAEGATITLHGDMTLTADLAAAKNVTIDLNGYTLTTSVAQSLKGNLINGKVAGTVSVAAGNSLVMGDVEVSGLTVAEGATVTLNRVQVLSAIEGALTGVTVQNDVIVMVPETNTTWNGEGMNLPVGGYHLVNQAIRTLEGTEAPAADAGYYAHTFTTRPDAKIGETYYPSLSEAWNAVSDGGTITLLRDVDTSDYNEVAAGYGTASGSVPVVSRYYVATNKSVTLDMGGFSVTDSMCKAPSGSTSAPFYFRGNSGTVTLKNGTIRSETATFAINNTANLVMESVNVEARGNAICMYTTNGSNTLTVNGGIIFGGLGAPAESAENCSHAALDLRKGTVTVNGGAVFGSNGNTAVTMAADTTLTQNGGTYMSSAYAYNVNGSSITKAAGATTTVAATASRVARTMTLGGETVTYLADIYGSYNARVNGTDCTLEDALAMDGEITIELLDNCTVTGDVTLKAGQTLDLAGMTLDVMEGKTFTVNGTVSNENGGAVNAKTTQIVLGETGNYLGYRIPAGLSGTVHPAADIHNATSYNLELDSAINLNCYVEGTVATAYEDLYVWNNDASSMVELTKTITEEGLKMVASANYAKAMADEMNLTIVGELGGEYYVGKMVEVSIKQYAEKILGETNLNWNKNSDASLGRTMIAMLNYGAAAQQIFNYNASDLANANVTDDQNAKVAEKFTSELLAQHKVNEADRYGDQAERIYGTSIILGENMYLKFWFHLPANADRNNYRFNFSYTNYRGNQVSEEVYFSDLEYSGTGSYYTYSVKSLAAADIKTVVTATVFDGADNVLALAKDSLSSNITRCFGDQVNGMSVDTLLDLMLTYGLSAHDFFVPNKDVIGGEDNELPIA